VEHIQAGDVDVVISALTHSQQWEAGADFTLSIFDDGQALLVRGEDTTVYDSPAALGGQVVGVVTGSDTEDALTAVVPFTLTVQNFSRFDDAVYALGAGEVAAVADQRRRLFWGMSLLPGSVIAGQYEIEPVAIAYPQNDPYFANVVNLTLQDMIIDGTYSSIYQAWFAQSVLPSVEVWPESSPEAPTAVPSLAEAPLYVTVPDTINRIQQRGRVEVAVVPDRSPFAYFDANGALVGYDVSLVQLMVTHWLGDPALVDFLPASLVDGMEMMHSGQADMMIGAVQHDRAGEVAMDFSITTYIGGQGLMVWAGTPITTVRDLAGLQVAVVDGTESREVVLAAAQAAGVSVSVLPQATLEDCITLMNADRVSAVVGERTELLGPAYQTQGLGVLPLRLTQVPLAIALPSGDSAFRDLVNLTLQAMHTEGQFDGLYGTWFDDDSPLQVAWPGSAYRLLRLEVAQAATEGE
jgi:ABC-type amino acid transport substrate-binding protein